MSEITFDRSFSPRTGEAVELADGVRRICCGNQGPLTFTGTNSYIVGHKSVAIIDPGPDSAAHLSALLKAVEDKEVTHILITHTHADHSSGAMALKEKCGAPIHAHGPHRPSRPLHVGELNPFDAEADDKLQIDHFLADGDLIEGDGWALEAIHTPGHAANHLCFSMKNGSGLFSGDHVMGWSTTIVAPPDGSMADYMNSLDVLSRRDDPVFWPGHGGPITMPRQFIEGLKAHRRKRETLILARMQAGDKTIKEMVASVYRDVAVSLHPAAALSMFAQMEYLVQRGIVVCLDRQATIDARYEIK